MTEEGIWTTGRRSKEEQGLFNSLMSIAVAKAAKGELPWECSSNPKIRFKAWLEGKELHVYYSWRYPPEEYWCKETRTSEECVKCLPDGIKGDAAREIWCMHTDYNYSKCSYGVPTPRKPTLTVLLGDLADG